MKLKKLAAMAMAGAMVIGTGSTVCAAPIETLPGTSDQEVVATYTANASASTVYSVDVAWGSMEFTYTVANEGNWNPETHQFDSASEGNWSCNQGQDKVTVTNHSNAPVEVGFSYTAETNYQGITGSFDKTGEQLATAEGTKVAEAPTTTAQLTLSGKLDKSVQAGTTIGSATVSLAAVQ